MWHRRTANDPSNPEQVEKGSEVWPEYDESFRQMVQWEDDRRIKWSLQGVGTEREERRPAVDIDRSTRRHLLRWWRHEFGVETGSLGERFGFDIGDGGDRVAIEAFWLLIMAGSVLVL